MMKDWKRLSWYELADQADEGLRGQGSLVEAMQRLDKSTRVLGTINGILAAVIAFLTLVMAIPVARQLLAN